MRKMLAFYGKRFLLDLCLFISVGLGLSQGYAADLSEVENILGVPGQIQEGAVVFSFPRSDIEVAIDGDPVPTALGFGSWTAWKVMGNDFMVMGDLVLLEKEINPVISALAEANINVTALHNHFIGEEPRIMYMHIGGMGPAATLANGVRNALDKTGTPKTKASASAPVLALDTKRIEEIIGHPGKAGGGVFKITLGRPGVKMGGVELTASMGLNTWAAFAGTDERAHVAGDVAMIAPEVQKVIRELRKGGINIAAVHNHMLDEAPRIFFLHYWGKGPAEKLAETVHDAFDQAKGPIR
ncbi:MAG: DUF1259 domain-containing protein [Desulfobacterales bacterium]|nr:DUF1259 domain-containing protein [Desulfobacterales bacterium]